MALRDVEARNALVLEHWHLPARVAKDHWGWAVVRRLGWEDAKQVAYLEVVRAAAAWDETRGVPFTAFAYPYCRNGLLLAAYANGLVKVPRWLQAGKRREAAPPDLRRPAEAALAGPARLTPALLAGRPAPEVFAGLSWDEKESLGDALGRLPGDLREALRLRFEEGLTMPELGARLGGNLQWAKRLVRKALHELGWKLGTPREGFTCTG